MFLTYERKESKMLKIVKKNGSKKYNGSIELSEAEVNAIELTFNTKFEAFTFGIESSWSKKMIMKHCLQTTREQYFHNYYSKYLASLV